MSWYCGLILAICLLPLAAWVQLVIHELSHVLVGKYVQGRTIVGFWVWPHWCAHGVEAPVRWWLPGRKKPERSWFNSGPDWGVSFYLGRCWTRGEDLPKHAPRCIAPMWAGLAAMVLFGIPCIWFWPAFAPSPSTACCTSWTSGRTTCGASPRQTASGGATAPQARPSDETPPLAWI